MTHSRYGRDADWVEFGVKPSQGSDDLSSLIEQMKEGTLTNEDIVLDFPTVYSRNCRAIDRAWAIINKRRTAGNNNFRRVEVFVLWGEAGCGKTRECIDRAGDEPPYMVEFDAHKLWWDGYNGQKTIIFDDFYGQVQYSEILRLLDGHQKRLNVKGSYEYAQWTKVFFTSNKCPCLWYKSPRAWDLPAFRRRVPDANIIRMGDAEECDHQPRLHDHDAIV